MELVYILALTISNIVCVIIGAKLGQKAVNGEQIELPTLNPMKVIREHQDRKEAEREADKFNTLMHNIDAYDGTSNGQKDV